MGWANGSGNVAPIWRRLHSVATVRSPAVRRAGVTVIAVLVVSVALAGIGSHAPGNAPLSSTAAVSTGVTSAKTGLPATAVSRLTQRIAADERAGGLPKADLLVPNIAYTSVREGSAIVPSNVAQGGVQPGPTSIGVNDLGLRTNSAGAFVPYSYRTTSLDGTVSINNISLLPIENNASNSITLQLNAILNNVTFFGQSIYQIWAQNVIFYSVAGDQMQLATDGWNFTGAPFELFQNDIYQNSPGGFLFGGTYVHAVPSSPPAFTLRPPFTISFYLNATNIDGRNALFFNYSLSSAHDIKLGQENFGKSISDGSFDWIIFNSTAGMPAGYTAPPASFLISGSVASGLGLPNDAEIAICGGSDGFSALTRSLNASARLQFLNSTTGRYSAVPAAFTTTEDTGESMEGVDAHFTTASAGEGLAYLTNGPEFVYGLWNASGPGIQEREYSVTASPASTLIWVSPRIRDGNSTFDPDLAAWDMAPTAATSFWLPTGASQHFTAEGMANDYDPVAVAIAPGVVNPLNLPFDLSQGVYVPIIAFGNSGVASIAQSGDGSVAHPYIISYPQNQPISSLFGTIDVFTEPLYPGLLLSGVSAHVIIDHPPNFYTVLPAETLLILQYYYGLSPPSYNYLPMEVYDSSNISIVHAAEISGWFPVTLAGFLMASLYLSNDSNTVIAYNQFSSMGSAMVIVDPNGNGTHEDNTVFGNVFVTNPVTSGPNGSSLYLVRAFNTTYSGPPAVGGLGVFSSGNWIYNNLFETPITAYSPPQNPYLAYVYINDFGYTNFASVAATWHNHWDIPVQPAYLQHWVNEVDLTGSIVGEQFVAGNAWANWNGTLPYTDAGLIVAGGDHIPVPVPGSAIHAVLFEEAGLPAGALWSVRIDGTAYRSSDAWRLVYEPAGVYSFSVPNRDGKTADPSHGMLKVSGPNLVVIISF
jgi:thermopsin